MKRVLVLGLGGFLLGYALTALLFFRGRSGGPVVTVPDVRQMDLARAERVLRRVDLGLEVGDSFPNAAFARGTILAQTPLPGQEVAPDSRVSVILSSGAERRPVPRVTALGREQAVRILEASGLRVTVVEEDHPTPAGKVVRTEPAGGTVVEVPREVRLVVSTGPPLVEVPRLVGMTEAEAAAAIQAAQLRVEGVRRLFHPVDPPGLVMAQRPAGGDSIRAGTGVELDVTSRELPGTPVRAETAPPERPGGSEAPAAPAAPQPQ